MEIAESKVQKAQKYSENHALSASLSDSQAWTIEWGLPSDESNYFQKSPIVRFLAELE